MKKIFVIVVFFILAVSFTWPLIFCFPESIYGFSDFKGDPLGTMWWIWWYRHAWTNNIDANLVPIVNYPFGMSFKGLPVAPLLNYPIALLNLVIQNEIITYNLVILFGIFFTAVCAFLLIRYLTGSSVGGFLGGLIFGFCPNQMMHAAQHLGFVFNFWIVLYILSLFKLKDDFGIKNMLFCILSGAGTVLTNYYYGYFILIFTGLFLLYWYNEFKIKLKYILITFAAILLLCIPFAAFFLVTKNSGVVLFQPIGDLFKYSAHWYDYFIPSEFHPSFGEWARKISRHYFERSLYLGYLPLLLGVWAIAKNVQGSKVQSLRVRFFAIVAIVFFVFSLSPIFYIDKLKIPNFSYFAYKILPMFRVYARMGILVIFSISVLAGYGLKYILEKIRGARIKGCVASLCVVIVLFEYANFPPFHSVDLSKIPEVYSWLANEQMDRVIVEYPFVSSIEARHSEYLFYQRIHKKRLINGASEGTLGDAFRRECTDLAKTKTLRLLAYLGVDYVIVHKDRYNKDELMQIGKNHWLVLVRDFKDAVVYKLTAKPERLPVIFWKNFASWEKWGDGNYWRWMGNDATVWIGNGPIEKSKIIRRGGQKSKLINLKFKILAFARERELEVYVNDALVKKLDIFVQSSPMLAQEIVLNDILLQPGENVIGFYTPQGEDRIGDVLHNNDDRKVSFAINGFEVEVLYCH